MDEKKVGKILQDVWAVLHRDCSDIKELKIPAGK